MSDVCYITPRITKISTLYKTAITRTNERTYKRTQRTQRTNAFQDRGENPYVPDLPNPVDNDDSLRLGRAS